MGSLMTAQRGGDKGPTNGSEGDKCPPNVSEVDKGPPIVSEGDHQNAQDEAGTSK